VNVNLSLLTVSFVPENDNNLHIHEVYAAIAINLQNKFISDVYVMTESDCGTFSQAFRQTLARMANRTRILYKSYRKFWCVPSPTGHQPTYEDLFKYANTTLAGKLVLLANADIVYDETLNRVVANNHSKLVDPLTNEPIAYVLSMKKPPDGSKYLEVFGKECRCNAHTTCFATCTIGTWQHGWPLGGNSWDAYIFATPLPSAFNLAHTRLPMNYNGAESMPAYQLLASGVQLYNPCFFINAFHWHYQGWKMHGSNIWANSLDFVQRHLNLPGAERVGAVAAITPCWQCPLIKMPKGYLVRENLCKSGIELDVRRMPHLARYFRIPFINVSLCCASVTACSGLNLQEVGSCRNSHDLNCVMWDSVPGLHQCY